MDRIDLETILPVPARQTADVFWNIERWHGIWNPIQQVTVLYDDGRLQEFEMVLVWNDAPITIRTLRIREPNGDIEFFSPNPPGEFSHHTGHWRFSAVDPSRCRVRADREFDVRREPGESGNAYRVRKEKVHAAFRVRLRRILDAFQVHAVHGFND
jgi:hypothetical protein